MNPHFKRITLVLLQCYGSMNSASLFFLYLSYCRNEIKIQFGLIETHLQSVIEHWFMIIAP